MIPRPLQQHTKPPPLISPLAMPPSRLCFLREPQLLPYLPRTLLCSVRMPHNRLSVLPIPSQPVADPPLARPPSLSQPRLSQHRVDASRTSLVGLSLTPERLQHRAASQLQLQRRSILRSSISRFCRRMRSSRMESFTVKKNRE